MIYNSIKTSNNTKLILEVFNMQKKLKEYNKKETLQKQKNLWERQGKKETD